MNVRKLRLPALCMTLCILLGGCAPITQPGETDMEAAIPQPQVKKAEPQDVNRLPLTDDPSLYSAYDPLEVPCFYVTVRRGTESDGTNHTFEEVNSYLNLQGMTGVEKIYADAIVQVGDENGPLPGEVGFGATEPNATINVRGRTSTGYGQKSYRLSLNGSAGLWRGQRAIALNKHPGDVTRLRNALYFRLLQDVPDMVSLRTQFVHLYIKDETAENSSDAFVDYGLFTQVELPNNRYLRNHGLSRDGGLYKANMCELFRYPEAIRLATDPLYDLSKFSGVLEPKVSENHEKLIEMLDAVNNYDLTIQDIVEKYFDVDNLTSYMAFNILMGNEDSNAQNYFLYNPVGSDTWYYICWDGDGALAFYEDELLGNAWAEGSWTLGVSNYWGVTLFNRMLRVEDYRDMIREKMERLRAIITPERVAELIAQYRIVVDVYTARMPDAVNMRIESAQLERIYENLPHDLDTAYRHFLESFEKPMPFYMDDAHAQAGKLRLSWGDAYDFDGEFVHYTVQVARDWSFAPDTLVYESAAQLKTEASLPVPAKGVYYWRVTARNASGHTQIAYDQVETSAGIHTGTRRFTVAEDGTVTNTR